jgi:predicted PurR-regulated permease PerM
LQKKKKKTSPMTGLSFSFTKKLFSLFLIIAALYFGKDFIIPLVISTIMATFFLPLCKWLEKKKIHRLLSPLICILVILICIGGVVALLGWQFSSLAEDASMLKERIGGAFDKAQEYIYNSVNVSKAEQTKMLKEEQSSVAKAIPALLGSLAYLLTNFIIVLVYIYLLLYYRFHIIKFILKLSAPAQRKEVEEVVYKAANVSQQYLLGLAKMIICLWIMYGIGFSIAGVENFIFFAIICGLLEIVPYIGNITGVSLTLLVTAVQGGDSSILIGILITYAVIQLVQTWILESAIVGPQVKINPLFTIFALVIGELIWGIPGVVLAIPLVGMLKIVYDHIESLKPYGFLLGVPEANHKNDKHYLAKIKKWLKSK